MPVRGPQAEAPSLLGPHRNPHMYEIGNMLGVNPWCELVMKHLHPINSPEVANPSKLFETQSL